MKIHAVIRLLAGLAAFATAAAGLFAGGVWKLGVWRSISFGPDYVPMAPATAVLFVLLGLGLAGQRCWPGSRTARVAGVVGAVLTLIITALVLGQAWHAFALPWDGWPVAAAGQVGEIPLGRMSPLTAATFLLAAVALLGQSTGVKERSLVRQGVAWLAGIGCLIGLMVGIGYASGSPLNYGGDTIPMALLTALAFMALNAGLLLAVIGDGLSSPRPEAGAGGRHAPESRAFILSLIAGIAVVCLALILAGFYYLRRAQTAARLRGGAELSALVALKAAQITAWRNERLGDARFLLNTGDVTRDVAAFVANPSDREARAQLLGWLEPIKGGTRYESVLVFDAAGRRLLAIPEALLPAPEVSPDSLTRARAGRGPTFTDLTRSAGAPAVHLDLLVPIRPVIAGKPAGQAETIAPLAVVVLRLNPADFLYPLLEHWPVPSATAEFILVRQEGEEIVYLNPLRHRSTPALTLRRSSHDPLLPAVLGAGGEHSVREGRDYRGGAVLAASQGIAGSPWTVMGKIDQAEIYAPLRRDLWQTGALGGLLLLTVVLTGFGVWRERHTTNLRRALRAELDRKALAERLALITQHANDVFLFLDENGLIIEANERAMAAYGYTLEEFRALPSGGLRPASTRDDLPQQFELFASADGAVFETVHQRKDGSVFPVEVSGRAVTVDGRRHILAIYRDITERKAHEHEIERLNRIYFVISEVNQALVHAKSREELFAEVCRVLVETGRFRIVWIGWLNPATRIIEPVAIAGDETGYVAQLRISADAAVPEGQGPSGTAFREGTTHVCNDFFADPATLPWREHAARAGFRSSIALPLRCGGQTLGLLTVYAAERDFFQPRQIELIEETTGDVSFALDVFAGEARRREAEAAVRASESRLQLLITSTPAIIYSLRADGDYATTFLSPNIRLVLGYETETAFRPDFWRSCVHPDDIAAANAAMATLAEPGGPDVIKREYRFRHADGSWRWMHDETRLVRDAEGRPQELVGYWIDITERKLAEQSLQTREEIFSSIVNQAADAIVLVEVGTGRFIEFNRAAHDGLGYTREEFAALNLDDIRIERKPEEISQIMEHGTLAFESAHRHRDGSRREVRVSARLLHLQGRDCIAAVWNDITETKHTAAVLENQRRFLSDLIEHNPLQVYVKDRAGRYQLVNQAFVDSSRRIREDIIDRTAPDLFPGPDGERFGANDLAVMAAGVSRTYEEELSDGEGRGRSFLSIKFPVRNATGEIIGVCGVTMEVTERKQIESALRENEERYRLIAENTTDLIWLYDLPAGRFKYFSPSVERMLGYTPGEVMRFELTTVLTPASAAEARLTVQRRLAALAAGDRAAARHTGQYEHVRKDGGIVIGEVVSTLLLDAAGKPTLLLGVTRDITGRVEADKKLRQLSRTIEQAPLSIVITDLAGAIEYVNPAFLAVTGYTQEEVLGQNPRVLKSGLTPPETYADMWHTLARGEVWRGELSNKKKNGAIYHERIVIAPVADESGQVTHYVALKEDITLGRQTEAALRETQERYRLIAENTNDTIWLYDVATDRFTYCSPSVLRLRGYTPEEALGQHLLEVLTPESAAYVARLLPERLARFAAGDRADLTQVVQVDQLHRDGHAIPTEVAITLLADAGGRVIQLLGVTRDITERKKAEASLRENEQRYRELFDLESDTILLLEADSGRIIRANQAAAALYGCSVAELETLRNVDLSAEPDQTALRLTRWDDRPDGSVVHIPLRQHRRRDGSVFPVEMNLRFFERDGRRFYLAAIRDITLQVAARETLERFNTELEGKVALRTEELAARTRQIEALLNAIPDTVMRLRSDGSILFSQRAQGSPRLAAVTPEEAVPARPQAPATTGLLAACLELGRRALGERNTVTGESEILTSDGAITVELRSAPTAGEEFVVFVRDITARKRLEAETAALLERERQVSEMKTRFISVTSHEFRTPMTAIMGSVELLANHLDSLEPEKRTQLYDRINSSLHRMTEMLDDMLTLNRVDAGRIEVRPMTVDLGQFVRNLVEEIRAGDHDAHRFELQLPEAAVPLVTDPGLLHHIVSNLLSNAVRYSPAGTVITLRAVSGGDGVRLEVEDQGIGIPPADRERIFEPFERGSNVGHIKGTGLGLNIVQRMTGLLGGSIAPAAVPGGGTRFILVLPRLPLSNVSS